MRHEPRKKLRRAGLCVALLLGATRLVAADDTRSLLAIEPRSPWTLRELEALSADLVSYDPDTGVAYVTANAAEQRRLVEHGFAVSTIELDVLAGFERLAQDPGLGLYTTWDELVLALETLHATFPDLTHLEVIGTSLEGRSIHALKISDEPDVEDPDEADVLIVGNHHARELMSVEVPLHFARTLLNGYRSDARIRRLVDEREVWIVPMLNPDGHVYQQETQGRPGWRKNRRREGEDVVGVDLNRNYSFQWGLDDRGSSGEPLSETYRGTAAFSEPESRALAALVERQAFTIALSYHSFGELLLYPWGHTRDVTTPDHAVFVALAGEMVRDNGYRPGNAFSGAIYLTNGGWGDYMYGALDARKEERTFAFTVELNSLAEGGFWPAESLIQPTCERLLSMNLYTVEVAANVRDAIPPLAPVLSATQDPIDPRIVHLSWQQPGDAAQIDHYEVFEIDPLGGPDSWKQTRSVTLERSARALLAENVRIPRDGRLVVDLEARMQPLWDYAYVQVRAHGEGNWVALPGDATRDASPTGRNKGSGISGSLHRAARAFDARRFAGRQVDVALRLDAHPDAPRTPRVSAALDVGATLQEERRVIAPDVRETRYDVIAERPGIFAYGVTAVDRDGQRTDSEIAWFVIPEFTEVELQDIVLEQDATHARLRWRTRSHSEARFTVWTRALASDEMPATRSEEWARRDYVEVAAQQVAEPGPTSVAWEMRPGRHAVLLAGEDADGKRFWGPWVTVRQARTRLAPAWPNPFNPSTRLRYEIATSTHVTLDIVDVHGRRVRRLIAASVAPGAHEARWDGRDDDGRAVASGVYVARLQTNDRVRTQRVVLLR